MNDDGSLGERNDVVCASIEHKLGIHGSPTAVLVFGEKGGALGELIGLPNRGLEYMFTMMNHARLNVGLQGLAIAERAHQQAVAYARERVQGKPVGWTEAKGAADRRPPGRRPHAGVDEEPHRGDARPALCGRSKRRSCPCPPRRGGAQGGAVRGRSAGAGRQGLVDRDRRRHRLARRPDPRRHGLHRRDRRRPAPARCPHHHDLRGHHGDPVERAGRPRGAARRRSLGRRLAGGARVRRYGALRPSGTRRDRRGSVVGPRRPPAPPPLGWSRPQAKTCACPSPPRCPI